MKFIPSRQIFIHLRLTTLLPKLIVSPLILFLDILLLMMLIPFQPKILCQCLAGIRFFAVTGATMWIHSTIRLPLAILWPLPEGKVFFGATDLIPSQPLYLASIFPTSSDMQSPEKSDASSLRTSYGFIGHESIPEYVEEDDSAPHRYQTPTQSDTSPSDSDEYNGYQVHGEVRIYAHFLPSEYSCDSALMV